MADIKKIKLGDTTYDIKDAGAARIADATISSSSNTTVAVGGIKKGTSLNGKSVAEVIEEIFFPYVAFSFSSISTSASSGTKEYGTTVTVNKVTPTFTAGSKAINSVKIGTSSGGNDLYSGTSATSNSAITLTTNKVFNGTTGGTIYCTLSDGTTTTTKNTSVSYAYYTYYAVTDTISIPNNNDWIPVNSTTNTDISINSNAGQYIWIAHPNNYTGISEYNNLSGSYNPVAATTKYLTQDLTNAQGYLCSGAYIFYRLTNPRTGTLENKFQLSDK